MIARAHPEHPHQNHQHMQKVAQNQTDCCTFTATNHAVFAMPSRQMQPKPIESELPMQQTTKATEG